MAGSGVILDPALVFAQLLSSNPAVEVAHPLFSLPASIKRQIYGFCFPLDTRKINLSPRFATNPVWPDGHFVLPWDILEDVMGGLGSFKALRSDLITFFWAEYHFHVILTPFNGPKFSPLSHMWMQAYLRLVQRLTVEVDLTRFGGSQLVDAPGFGYNVEKIEALLADIVKGILVRSHWIPMAEFNLMYRRFEGFRPRISVAAAESYSTICGSNLTAPKDVPYIPDEIMFLCDVVSNLRGIVQSTQVSGFTRQYSHMLLSALFAAGNEELYYRIPDSTPWPVLLPGSIIIPTPKDVSEFKFGLHSNFSQDLAAKSHNEMHIMETVFDKATTDEPPAVNNEITDLRNSTTISSVSAVPLGHDLLFEKKATNIDERPASFKLPDRIDEETSTDRLYNRGFPQSKSEYVISDYPTTSEATYLPSNNSVTLSQAEGMPSKYPETPEKVKSILRTPTPTGKSKQLSSLSEMNKLNEQDPAFRRALEGLRSVNQQPKGPADITRPKSALSLAALGGRSEQVDRGQHHLTNPESKIAGKEGPTFLGKIKGIFSK